MKIDFNVGEISLETAMKAFIAPEEVALALHQTGEHFGMTEYEAAQFAFLTLEHIRSTVLDFAKNITVIDFDEKLEEAING